MVSSAAVIFMMISLGLSVLVPLIVLFLLMKARKGVFGIWLVGALGFIVPQLIIRIPVLQILGQQPSYQRFAVEYPVLLVVFLAVSAALFETTGRLVVLKYGLGRRLSFTTGLAAGAGHGGIEAIVLVGLTYVNNLVISWMINAGNLAALFPNDPVMADNIRQQLVGTAPYIFLMGGIERLFSMAFHIALSVLLTFLIMKRRTVAGFILVALMHFTLDFLAGWLQVEQASVLLIEGILLIIAIMSYILVIRLRPRFSQARQLQADAGEQAVPEGY